MTTFKNFDEVLEYIRNNAQLGEDEGVEHYANIDDKLVEQFGANLGEDAREDALDALQREVATIDVNVRDFNSDFVLYNNSNATGSYEFLTSLDSEDVASFIDRITAA